MRSREEIEKLLDELLDAKYEAVIGDCEEDFAVVESLKSQLLSALSPSPVPVEELRAGKYRMTVEVEIAHGPCGTDLVKIGKPESTGPIMYLEWFTNETVSAIFTEAPNE